MDKKTLLISVFITLPIIIFGDYFNRLLHFFYTPTPDFPFGGCFDTTKQYGWPRQFYSTAGEFLSCGEGHIAAKFNVLPFIIDALLVGIVIYFIIGFLRDRLQKR